MVTDEEKKEIVEQVVLKFENWLETYTNGHNLYGVRKDDIRNFIKLVKREYDLLPKYPTLREYICDNNRGSYHHFVFYLDRIKVDVTGIWEFEQYYHPHFLDDYVVVKDEKSDNGGSAEQYQAIHKLTIKKKEE